MTWATSHAKSEAAASRAALLRREGKHGRADAAYRRAAAFEERALAALAADKPRTLGITVVSAASLWYKGRAFDRAEALAIGWLAREELPLFARTELREVLQRVWSEQALAKSEIRLADGYVVFGVKGGEVAYGGAPLDLVAQKVEDVKSLYYRTAEMIAKLPLRRRGEPDQDIQQLCRPWLFQVPPGSYQFAVRIQEPEQTRLFPDAIPSVAAVATTFLEIMRAAASAEPEKALPEVVPDAEYRDAFLKLARNLAPTGERFGSLEIRAGDAPPAEGVVLRPANRDAINHAIKGTKPRRPKKAARETRQIIGILRGLHLDRDWLEVAEGGLEGPHITIHNAGEILDDVVGPMVNRRVLVDANVGKGGRLEFVDIQLAE